jgi:hypothetical protein
MNKAEKLTAILERLKTRGTDIDGAHISSMVIVGYLDDLAKEGVIESAWNMTPLGSNIRAICEEFDWKPDDDEIKAFVMEMVEPKEQAPFMLIIKKYRDDRQGLLEDFKKAKETFGEEPPSFSQ